LTLSGSVAENITGNQKRVVDPESGKSSLLDNDHLWNSTTRYNEVGSDDAITVAARATRPNARSDHMFFEEHEVSLRDKAIIARGSNFDFGNERQIFGTGWACRQILRQLMMWSMDEINNVRLSCQIQLFLPFTTGYESCILSMVIESLDVSLRKKEMAYILSRIANFPVLLHKISVHGMNFGGTGTTR